MLIDLTEEEVKALLVAKSALLFMTPHLQRQTDIGTAFTKMEVALATAAALRKVVTDVTPCEDCGTQTTGTYVFFPPVSGPSVVLCEVCALERSK